MGLNQTRLVGIEVCTLGDFGHTTPQGNGDDLSFSIKIDWDVFWSLYRSEKLTIAPSRMTGPSALRHYILYHELGHCVDDLERGDLETYSSQSAGSFDPELNITNHVHICLGEYAASWKAATFMSPAAWQTALEEFRNLLASVRFTVATDQDILNVARGVWKVIIEYTKLAASLHGREPTGRACDLIGGPKVTAACGRLDDYLRDLWNRYPRWNQERDEFHLAWTALSEQEGPSY
jgi:hypothetical protein